MIRRIITFIFFISTMTAGYAQLVTKKDYTAAFALQAGAESGVLMTSEISKINITPVAGLKMTFPFNRKWFIGSEINYSQLKTRNKYSNPTTRLELDLEQITVPVYVKYMLNSNRGMLLFGGYASCLLSDKYNYSTGNTPLSSEVASSTLKNGIKKWDYGFTMGYEQLFTRHLALAFKINCGVQSLTEVPDNKKFIPLKASLTLSYDLFHIGDCGCH